MFGKRITDYLVYLLVRVLIAGVQGMRFDTCRLLARGLAWLLGEFFGMRSEMIDENLTEAYPELHPAARRELARRSWEHLFLMSAELAHAERKIHETNWRDFVCLDGARELVGQLLQDRPTVIVSGHFGNFEIARHMFGLFGFHTTAIARTLDNPYLDRWLNGFRSESKQSMLPKKGSAEVIHQWLSANGILLVLGDQAAGPKGCWVDFFGRPASTHKAIAVFALIHEAPLLVCYGQRLGEPMQFLVGTFATADPRHNRPETRSVRALTQWFTTRLEEIVRRAPEQYWWVHRRWKQYPKSRRRMRRAA